MPIFGAAYAAPNKDTTILYWFRSLSTGLSPTEKSRIQGLFKTFEWFSSTFQADLIFKDFSRKSFKFKYFSSLWKPCLYPNIASVTDGTIKGLNSSLNIHNRNTYQSTIFGSIRDLFNSNDPDWNIGHTNFHYLVMNLIFWYAWRV